MNILDIAIAKKLAGGGGGSGTDNYNDLSNLPKINDTTLSGNKSSSALGLQSEINSDSKLASDLVDDTNQDNKFVTSAEKTTWNAKQNAIDADHKLSSSLVSFSEAEAAAIASGIDSSKVGQISTNQTNISLVQGATEELVDDGAKNLFDDNNITELERLSQSGNVYTATVNDTANKFNLMGYQAAPSAVVARSIYTPDIDTNGVVFGVFTKDPSATSLIIGHSGTTINNDIRFDISSLVNGEQYVLAINITQYNPQNTLQFKDVMICTKSKFDISPAYEPFALPNTDLTVLEAEDRAALAEVVDSGAKNLANLPDATIDHASYIFNEYGLDLPAGSYVFCYESVQDADNGVQLILKDGSGNILADPSFSSYTGKNSVSFTITSTAKRLLFWSNATGTYSKFMICTKAAYGVSQAYVPFTLKQPRVISKKADATVSTTETILTDLTFTVPAKHIAEISVMQHWANATPRLIRIATNNTMADDATIAYVEESTKNFARIQAYGIFSSGDTDKTVYISAKSSSQAGASNAFYLFVKLYSV